MTTESKNTRNHHSGIWLVALLLLILTIATSALLASILKGISKGEQNVIALFPNKTSEAMATKISYEPAKLDPELEAYDKESSWETSTDVDLFKNTYTGEDGKVTVQSANGDKIIAPGTQSSYQFSLKNTGNVSLTYKLSLDSVFQLANQRIPFEVRLSKGNDWIIGNAQHWGSIEELNTVTEKDELGVGKYVTYTLEWQWPFGNDNADMALLQDLNDTIIADDATMANADFELGINTISEVTPGAVAEDENGKPIYEEVISHRNITYVGGPILGLAVAWGLVVFFVFWRRPIYVTGFISNMAGCEITCGKKSDVIRQDGRYVFPKLYPGICTFTIEQNGKQPIELQWKLRRQRDIEGVKIEYQEEMATIFISRKIRAIELYLEAQGDQLRIDETKWAAIDNKNNVYTIKGKQQPDEKKYNRTPGGLRVNSKHQLYF